jgi:hypothetical protein
VEKEHRKQRTLLRSSEGERATIGAGLERAENAELHRSSKPLLRSDCEVLATPLRHRLPANRSTKGGVVSLRTSLTVLVASTLAIAASSALAGGIAQPFRVTSTLDGQKVLPLRTHWIVRPQIAAAKVKEVDYLIDGKVRWVEHSAPYNFGGDDNGRNLGFLVTTWLSSGRHTFTAQVKTTDGSAIDMVVARVLPAPAPPAALAGTWTRTMTPQDQKKSNPKFGRDNVPPAGVWRLVFDQVGAWELDSLKTGLVNEYDVAGKIIHAYAPIAMAPCSDASCGVSRFGHHHIGGIDCTAAGPFGSYRWSVSGSQLTLAAVNEPCGQRRAIWEGTWTRVG